LCPKNVEAVPALSGHNKLISSLSSTEVVAEAIEDKTTLVRDHLKFMESRDQLVETLNSVESKLSVLLYDAFSHRDPTVSLQRLDEIANILDRNDALLAELKGESKSQDGDSILIEKTNEPDPVGGLKMWYFFCKPETIDCSVSYN
jgi:hypothetical protein